MTTAGLADPALASGEPVEHSPGTNPRYRALTSIGLDPISRRTLQRFLIIRSQPALEDRAGITVQPARDDRSCVYIQLNTRTLNLHWGLSHLVALPARTHFLSATHVHM